jgi:hypothetical protein
MRLSRPRFTIANLMTLVVIASLASLGIVMRIERNRRLAALQVAQAKYENAKLTREVAEIAVAEFTEGIFPQDLQSVDIEIGLAKSDLERALRPQGSDKRVVEQARGRLRQAEQKKTLLETNSKDKMVNDLKGEVARAAAVEQAAKAERDRLIAAQANQWW